MVDQLLVDPRLAIDSDQVYVVGFSSGGGQALVLGCVAPEVFAGVGAVAAPALGTESSEIAVVSTTAEQAASTCVQLAGENATALETQAAFSFADASDFTVSTAVNAEMFELVYAQGLRMLDADSLDLATLPGAAPAGAGMTYADEAGVRLAQLDSTAGEGHAWPSGSGTSAGALSSVHGGGLNMSQFAAEFFATHNPRTGGWEPPTGGTDGPGDSGGEPTDTTTGGTGGGSSTTGAGSATAGTTGAPEGSSGQGDVSATGEPAASEASGCSIAAHNRMRVMMLGLLLLGLRRRGARSLSV